MSGRSAIARSGVASIPARAAAVGVHAVDSLQALLALVSAPQSHAAALVLELPHTLAADPSLSDALRGCVQAGKALPVLALVVPRECVPSLRALAAELAQSGALVAVFIDRDAAAARLHAERQLWVLQADAAHQAAAAARSDQAFMGFLSALLSGEGGRAGKVCSAQRTQRRGS